MEGLPRPDDRDGLTAPRARGLGEAFDDLCAEFEDGLLAGAEPVLEEFLGRIDVDRRGDLLEELLRLEFHWRRRRPGLPALAGYLARFPGREELVGRAWDDADLRDGLARAASHRFRIIRRLGGGGAGDVYLAWDESLGRRVVLKEIRRDHEEDARAVARFENEARITGRLEHPGVPPIFAAGRHGASRPYFATRWLGGPTLGDAIARFHASGDEVPIDEWLAGLRGLLRRFLEAALVVEYAHANGVIHRDLKPANVLLGDHGETVVVDWGLGRILDDADPDALGANASPSASTTRPDVGPLTQAGDLLGTPGYAAPEQLGPGGGPHGPAADVYGLGTTLYHLLTGGPPFRARGSAPEALVVLAREAREGRFERPRHRRPRVPRALESICLKAMQPDPGARYASAADVARDVAAWLDGAAVSVAPDGPAARAWRWCRSRPFSGGAAAAVATLGLMASAAYLVDRVEARSRVRSWVADLASAGTADVPAIVRLLESEPDLARAYLGAGSAGGATSDERSMNLALAAARFDPEAERGLSARLAADGDSLRSLLTRLMHIDRDEPARFSALMDLLRPFRGLLAGRILDVIRRLEPTLDGPLTPDSPRLAEILLDYASDRPDVLAEAALFVPDEVYPKYVARVDAAPAASRAALEATARDLEPGWMLDEVLRRLPPPDPGAVAEVAAAGGVVEGASACATLLAPSRLAPLAEALRPAGYRPLRVRPVLGDPDRRLSVVWTRDDAGWEMAIDPDPAAIRVRDDANRARRRTAVEASCFERPGESGVSFVGIWADRPDPTRLERVRHEWAAIQAGWPLFSLIAPQTKMIVGLPPDAAAAAAEPIRGLWQRKTLQIGPDGSANQIWQELSPDNPIYFEFVDAADEPTLVDRAAHQEDVGCLWIDLAAQSVDDGRTPRFTPTLLQKSNLFASDLVLSASFAEEARRRGRSGARPLVVQAFMTGGGVRTASIWHRPIHYPSGGIPPETRMLSRHAALLFRLGEPGPLLEALGDDEDPTIRSHLIDHARELGIPVEKLADEFFAGIGARAGSAILSALAEDSSNRLDPAARSRVVEALPEVAAASPDAGLRSAALRLLRSWGEAPIASERIPMEPSRERDWFVDPRGDAFAVVRGPVEFVMGLPTGWDLPPTRDARHGRRIGRSFALAETELTEEAYLEYVRETAPDSPRLTPGGRSPYSTSEAAPAIGLSWLDAARYCNWRSRREGLRPCFDETPDGGAAVPADCLERDGYRLPTEAEWEFACRAGSRTPCWTGRECEDPSPVAWWQGNSHNKAHEVASFRPNALGLFDLLGNADEWCLDEMEPYCRGRCGTMRDDRAVPGVVDPVGRRVRRGGYFDQPWPAFASGHRAWGEAGDADAQAGFRLARTILGR